MIILIIIIICEIINRKCDENIWNVRYYFERPKYKNYIIDSIGITRSITHFWPNPKSDLNAHTDIITYCHNPKNNKFCYVILYTSNYLDLPLARIIDTDNIKYTNYLATSKVKPDKYLKFMLNNYKYRITEMYNLEESNKEWKIKDVYEILEQLLQIPYHRLKFNCHHVVNLVLEITLGKNRKHVLNSYEFNNYENYKPILYLYNYMKEQLGFKVVDKLNLKKIKEILNIIHDKHK
jgi:hypothetical protein